MQYWYSRHERIMNSITLITSSMSALSFAFVSMYFLLATDDFKVMHMIIQGWHKLSSTSNYFADGIITILVGIKEDSHACVCSVNFSNYISPKYRVLVVTFQEVLEAQF